MNKWLSALIVAGCLVGASVSMGDCGKCGSGHKHEGEHKHELCGKCGEEKGGDACCKEGAEKCSACGLHKGSPGCKEKCAVKSGS